MTQGPEDAPVKRPSTSARSDVLIVDDDPPIGDLLRQIFRRIGLSAYGVRAILSKPFEIHELIATVKTILEHKS